MNRRLAWLLFLAVAVASSSLAAEEMGTLTGRFVFDGKPPKPRMFSLPGGAKIADESLLVDSKTLGIANIAMQSYTRPGDKRIGPVVEGVVRLEVSDTGYTPRITVVHLPQRLSLTNTGSSEHLVRSSAFPFTPLLAPGETAEIGLLRDSRLPESLRSETHPELRGYLLVTEEFATVSDRTGVFTITGLPPGKWTFRTWHEQSGFVEKVKQDNKATKWDKGRVTLDIRPGGNDLGEILIAAEEFPEK